MLKATITGTHRHNLLVPDPGLRLFREFDGDGNVVFEMKTPGLSYDAWKLPDGTYLYAYISPDSLHGVTHVRADGSEITHYKTEAQIFSCQPLEDGAFLVGELHTMQLVEVAKDGKVRKIIPIQSVKSCHNTMRMCRKCPDGTYLVNQPEDKVIRRYDGDGNILSEIKTPGDTFAVVWDGKGGIYYTAQKEIFLVREADGTVLRHITEEDLAPINPCWLTGMELLEDGSLIVTNWLGHGMAGKGAPIFEIAPDGSIPWTLKAPEFTDCMANVQSLDEDAAAIIRSIRR